MENYDLEENEVVLYKGFVNVPNIKGTTELILTNINFVLITKHKKMFSKEQVLVDAYPVNEIKYYKDEPQVLKKGQHVELYFTTGETEFDFVSKRECKKFVDAARNLITNKNKFERGVEKVKNTVSIVDNTVGVANVAKVAGFVISKGYIGKTANVIGKGAKAIGKIIKK